MTVPARHSERLANEGVTGGIIKGFYRVYDQLGYGFLEKAYCNALALELTALGLSFVREAPLDVFYKACKVGHFRADFIVEGCVVVEVKASHSLVEADSQQLLNCLRAATLETGLLLHFGPKARFKRIFFENPLKRSVGPRENSEEGR